MMNHKTHKAVPGRIAQGLHHSLPVFLRMSHNIFVSSYAWNGKQMDKHNL